MCDSVSIQQNEAALMSQVNETDEGLKAAQELLQLRRKRWAHTDKCSECQKECEVPA